MTFYRKIQTRKSTKFNSKIWQQFIPMSFIQQVRLMIRPSLQVVNNLKAIILLFQETNPLLANLGYSILLIIPTRENSTWQQIQKVLSQLSFQNLISSYKTQIENNKLSNIQQVKNLLSSFHPEQNGSKQQWNYEMEMLCVALHDVITAILRYLEYRSSNSFNPQEEDEEHPQNLMIKMENFEGNHIIKNNQKNDKKKTPHSILKNAVHSKTCSQSTMSHNNTRPQTATGYITPEKAKSTLFSPNQFFKSKQPLESFQKNCRSQRSASSNSEKSIKKITIIQGVIKSKNSGDITKVKQSIFMNQLISSQKNQNTQSTFLKNINQSYGDQSHTASSLKIKKIIGLKTEPLRIVEKALNEEKKVGHHKFNYVKL